MPENTYRRPLTVAKLADLLDLHRSTIYDAIAAGEIRVIRIRPGGKMLIPAEEVDRLTGAVA